jgi:mRNA (guanine-N7-)-methyltransferase
MKSFHNHVKRTLLEYACSLGVSGEDGATMASSSVRLLDMATGRGGDVWKWAEIGISHVVALDICASSILEARSRYRDVVSSHHPEFQDAVHFDVLDLGVKSVPDSYGTFDVVSMMFAMHYFFESEDILRTVLKSISDRLSIGGLFVGTCVNGKRIMEAVCGDTQYENSAVRIDVAEDFAIRAVSESFGVPYRMSIKDTVVDTIGGGSLEFLVREEALCDVAAEYGLVPMTSLTEPVGCLEAVQKCCFMPFRPSLRDSAWETVSSMYTAFVFQKRE